MLTRKHSVEGKLEFGVFADAFADLDMDAVGTLSKIAGDVTLVLDSSGIIHGASGDPKHFPSLQEWLGHDWHDTVTVESKPKVMEMLGAARDGRILRWRQVNHPASEQDIPVRYAVVKMPDGPHYLAIGRDMRDEASLQQRFLQAQQALERDYMRLRQVENRYRLLFESVSEPVLVVDGDNHRILEANPAAHKLLDVKSGTLAGGKLPSLFARKSRDGLIAFLGSVQASSAVTPLKILPAAGNGQLTLSATSFRQRGSQILLVRLRSEDQVDSELAAPVLSIVDRMPDAFVLADEQMAIVTANSFFVDLVCAASLDQLRGKPLADYVGRPGIDLDLIKGQLAKEGMARNVSSVVGASEGFEGEPVELSAVQTDGETQYIGLVIRPVGRRMRDLPAAANELPRSVEQLTELVGRMSLKDIVRESTDLIERLCIEAALSHTSDNRASAAEILGLSRQSLYSKLHRHGLGNLVGDSD